MLKPICRHRWRFLADMAGHSQFKNIMHRKGAQDAKRSKVFAKLIRELTVAAREGGSDPDGNPRLRTAIAIAKTQNLPKDTWERAITRGAGQLSGESYEAVRYEGYAPGGVALIVEALTDNRNRTASEVRTAFAKEGGALAEANAVAFQFVRVGSIRYPLASGTEEEMFELAVEVGAKEVESSSDIHEFVCSSDIFYRVRAALEEKLSTADFAELIWKPRNTIAIGEQQALSVLKLIEVLEDNDDVQSVSGNFEVSQEVLEKLSHR